MGSVVPIAIDRNTGRELWHSDDCADHCGVTVSTWRSYSRSGNKLDVPAPVAHFGQSPLWIADEVKAWHAARPGSPVPNAPTSSRR